MEISQVKNKIERISITIDPTLLDRLDNYVQLQKTIKRNSSRAGEVCNLIEKYIPVDTP